MKLKGKRIVLQQVKPIRRGGAFGSKREVQGSINTKLLTRTTFKLENDNRTFLLENEALIEKGDEIGVVARLNNNGFYRVLLCKNLTRGWVGDFTNLPNRILTIIFKALKNIIGKIIGLFFLIIFLVFVAAIIQAGFELLNLRSFYDSYILPLILISFIIFSVILLYKAIISETKSEIKKSLEYLKLKKEIKNMT